MIKIILLTGFMMFSLADITLAQALVNRCPGSCLNTSGQAVYDGLCKGAGQAGGKGQCQKYANFGCVWTQKQEVVYPGSCVNIGGNSQYDVLCSVSGQTRGQRGCLEYKNLGCAWQAEQVYCQ